MSITMSKDEHAYVFFTVLCSMFTVMENYKLGRKSSFTHTHTKKNTLKNFQESHF